MYKSVNACVTPINLGLSNFALSPLYPQVRLSAISIMSTFYGQLGEEMIVLLPETIPYLAELLEGINLHMYSYYSTVIL